MCGFAGFIDHRATRQHDELAQQALTMANALTHRGPDDAGVWADASVGIGIGFRRLAILDLSDAGHQPMESRSGRYVIAFNGEIYNHAELRSRLSDHASLRGSSDTEVLLATIETRGIREALQRSAGMFALALWDRHLRRLLLARDRLGEKPLYYGNSGDAFVFASELHALRAGLRFDNRIDRNALALYVRYGYVPTPYSIYDGIYKLRPGTLLTVPLNEAPFSLSEPEPYWSAADFAEQAAGENIADAEAIEQLDGHLQRIIKQQMVADVPVGAFLSGGIDSSVVTAVMQSQSTRRVKTFSIGFEDPAYDEAEHAQAVARHLGTDHTQLYITDQDARDVIPELPRIYDEPFADSSQIPTYLVAKLAREQVTVSLSGDGGDELFCGYPRYLVFQKSWRRVAFVPRMLRQTGGRALTSLLVHSPARRFHRVAALLADGRAETLYRELVSAWKDPSELVYGSRELNCAFTGPPSFGRLREPLRRMMYIDLLSYLPDDILVKVDRATMAVSLESRAPLLDHQLVEFALQLPHHQLLRGGETKWILRQVLDRYVPRALVERPKMGFGVPLGSWLRGPLRPWAAERLDGGHLAGDGFFNPAPVQEKWQQHCAGDHDWSAYLWRILMFQDWYGKARDYRLQPTALRQTAGAFR